MYCDKRICHLEEPLARKTSKSMNKCTATFSMSFSLFIFPPITVKQVNLWISVLRPDRKPPRSSFLNFVKQVNLWISVLRRITVSHGISYFCCKTSKSMNKCTATQGYSHLNFPLDKSKTSKSMNKCTATSAKSSTIAFNASG